jgi:hypothetical protein
MTFGRDNSMAYGYVDPPQFLYTRALVSKSTSLYGEELIQLLLSIFSCTQDRSNSRRAWYYHSRT